MRPQRMWGLAGVVRAAALVGWLGSVTVTAQAQVSQGASSAETAEQIFTARCSFCHGQTAAYAPARATLESRSQAAIATALTTGSMQAMAGGLSSAEIQALATHLGRDDREAGAGAAPAAGNAGFCTDRQRPLATGGEWNGWGRDADNTRFQPQPGFAAADVHRLRVKWSFALDGGLPGQPTVYGDRVFVSSVPGRLHSLDLATGCIFWSYQSAPGGGGDWGGAGGRTAISVAPLPASAGPDRYAVYMGDDLGHIHAVDAVTGQQIWRTRVEEHSYARLTGSPVLHEGRLYVPVSSIEEAAATNSAYSCCTFRGSLVALDAVTGATLWKRHTIPDEPKPTRVNPAGTQMYGPAGGPIWSTPTVDARRGVIYATTGNSYTDEEQQGANALIAFDLATGEIRWRQQVVEADNFIIGCAPGRTGAANCPQDVGPDIDFGSAPILRTLPDGRQLLLAGNKGGVVYAFDPDDRGRVVWETRIGAGSALGGIQWGMAADDQIVYAAVSDASGPVAARRPGVNALRIATGEVVWHTPAPRPACSWTGSCNNAHSAAISLVPGLIFAGALDGHIRAYATDTGALVWSFDTARLYQTVNGPLAQGGSIDGPGPTIANGTLLLTSGYNRFDRRPGNVLVAFTIDGR